MILGRKTNEASESTESVTNQVNGVSNEVLHLEKAPLMDYTAVRSASLSRDPITGSTGIDIEFSLEGKDLFAAVTKEQLNKRLAIVLDGKIYAAPMIRSEIRDGRAQISGSFTEAEAQQLAAKINEAVHPQ